MVLNLLEKFQLSSDANLLIQGLPSSLEKQFSKLSFAKNVTPLLKSKKIDFAIIFCVNQRQLNSILHEVIPFLKEEGKVWVAYPKTTAKIATDLYKPNSWNFLIENGYKEVKEISLDHVWEARHFLKDDGNLDMDEINQDYVAGINYDEETIVLPIQMDLLLKKNKRIFEYFDSLSFTSKKEHIEWILSAKKEVTRQKRINETFEKLKRSVLETV
jgi:hypothetical protein